ncbi:MAG: hypothetical protein AAGJ80_00105 [Cyanobacteria bacterium J06553_1]
MTPPNTANHSSSRTYAEMALMPPTHPTTQQATRPNKRDNYTQVTPKKNSSGRNYGNLKAKPQRRRSLRNDRNSGRTSNDNDKNKRRAPCTDDRGDTRTTDVPPLLDSHEVREKADHDHGSHAPPPVRQWDTGLYHHVPGVPQPHSPAMHASSPNVVMHVSGGVRPRIYDQQHRYSHYEDRHHNENDDNGFQEVRSKREQRLQRLHDRGTQRGLKGAPVPDFVFLYVTNCDIDTTAEEVELHILEHFEQVTEVRARSTARSHDYYASFTVTVKGQDLDTDDFLNSEVFQAPIRVFLNKNKYPAQEDV